ncbi:MAG: response regulator transcription factor [Saprospiraceae bacterium]|nr:response regulator transcription factor [Saprospiraceae bacterium]
MNRDKNILVVEDDLNLGFLLVEFLESEGFFVKLCKDGQMGLQAIQRNRFDLCILDVMMPRMDGFTLAEQIRKQTEQMPFVFLTAKSRKEDKLKGYAQGAEDYITKPFDEQELLCKINVILRRKHQNAVVEQPAHQFQIGDYFFDYDLQELRYHDEITRLTEKENEILRLLCLHQNQILRREEAVEQVYGRKDYFLGRSFDVFISRLRKLLQHDARISIENVFKVGFILKVEI